MKTLPFLRPGLYISPKILKNPCDLLNYHRPAKEKPKLPKSPTQKIKYFQEDGNILMVIGHSFDDINYLKEINKNDLPKDFNLWRTKQKYYVVGRLHGIYIIEKENPE